MPTGDEVAVSCSGDCGFLAANLYAKSVFGEDALVNLSVEKGGDGKLSGYIRIRCAHPRHLSRSACSPQLPSAASSAAQAVSITGAAPIKCFVTTSI